MGILNGLRNTKKKLLAKTPSISSSNQSNIHPSIPSEVKPETFLPSVKKSMYLWVKIMLNDQNMSSENFMLLLSDPNQLNNLLMTLFVNKLQIDDLLTSNSYEESIRACYKFLTETLMLKLKDIGINFDENLLNYIPTILLIIIKNYELFYFSSIWKTNINQYFNIDWASHFVTEIHKIFKSIDFSKKDTLQVIFKKICDSCAKTDPKIIFGNDQEKIKIYHDLIRESRSVDSSISSDYIEPARITAFIQISCIINLLRKAKNNNNSCKKDNMQSNSNKLSIEQIAETFKGLIDGPEEDLETKKSHLTLSTFATNLEDIESVGTFEVLNQVNRIGQSDELINIDNIVEDTSLFQRTIIALRRFAYTTKDIISEAECETLQEFSQNSALPARVINLLYIKFALRCYINIYNTLIDYENKLMVLNKNFVASLENIIENISEIGNPCFNRASSLNSKTYNFYAIRIFVELVNCFNSENNQIFKESVNESTKIFNTIIQNLLLNLKDSTEKTVLDERLKMSTKIVEILNKLDHPKSQIFENLCYSKTVFIELCNEIKEKIKRLKQIQSINSFSNLIGFDIFNISQSCDSNEFSLRYKAINDKINTISSILYNFENSPKESESLHINVKDKLQKISDLKLQLEFALSYHECKEQSICDYDDNDIIIDTEPDFKSLSFNLTSLESIDRMRLRIDSQIGQELRETFKNLHKKMFLAKTIDDFKTLKKEEFTIFINPWIINDHSQLETDIVELNKSNTCIFEIIEDNYLNISVKSFESSKSLKVPYYYVILKDNSFSQSCEKLVKKIIDFSKSIKETNLSVLINVFMNLAYMDKFDINHSISSLDNFFMNHYPKIDNTISLKNLYIVMNKANIHYAILNLIMDIIEFYSWSSHYQNYISDMVKCLKKHYRTNEIVYASAYSYANLLINLTSEYLNPLSNDIQSEKLIEYDKNELNPYITLIKHYKRFIKTTFNCMSLNELHQMDSFESSLMYKKNFALSEAGEIKLNYFDSNIALALLDIKNKIDNIMEKDNQDIDKKKLCDELSDCLNNFKFAKLLKLDTKKLSMMLVGINSSNYSHINEKKVPNHVSNGSEQKLHEKSKTSNNQTFDCNTSDEICRIKSFKKDVHSFFQVIVVDGFNPNLIIEDIKADIDMFDERLKDEFKSNADNLLDIQKHTQFLAHIKDIICQNMVQILPENMPDSFKKINLESLNMLYDLLQEPSLDTSDSNISLDRLSDILDMLIVYCKNIDAIGKIIEEYILFSQRDDIKINSFNHDKSLIFAKVIKILQKQNDSTKFKETIELLNSIISKLDEDFQNISCQSDFAHISIMHENSNNDFLNLCSGHQDVLREIDLLFGIYNGNLYEKISSLSDINLKICSLTDRLSSYQSNNNNKETDVFIENLKCQYDQIKKKINEECKLSYYLAKEIAISPNYIEYAQAIVSNMNLNESLNVAAMINFLRKSLNRKIMNDIWKVFENQKLIEKYQSNYIESDENIMCCERFLECLNNFIAIYSQHTNTIRTIDIFPDIKEYIPFEDNDAKIKKISSHLVISWLKIFDLIIQSDEMIKKCIQDIINLLSIMLELLSKDMLLNLSENPIKNIIENILGSLDYSMKSNSSLVKELKEFASKNHAKYLNMVVISKKFDFYQIESIMNNISYDMPFNSLDESFETENANNKIMHDSKQFEIHVKKLFHFILDIKSLPYEVAESLIKVCTIYHDVYKINCLACEIDIELDKRSDIFIFVASISDYFDEESTNNVFNNILKEINTSSKKSCHLDKAIILRIIRHIQNTIYEEHDTVEFMKFVSQEYNNSLLNRFKEYFMLEEDQKIQYLNQFLHHDKINIVKNIFKLQILIAKNFNDMTIRNLSFTEKINKFECHHLSKYLNDLDDIMMIFEDQSDKISIENLILMCYFNVKKIRIMSEILKCMIYGPQDLLNIQSNRDTSLHFLINEIFVILNRFLLSCPKFMEKCWLKLIKTFSNLNEKKSHYVKKYLPEDYIDICDKEFNKVRTSIIRQLGNKNMKPIEFIYHLFFDKKDDDNKILISQKTVTFPKVCRELSELGIGLSENEKNILRRSIDLSGCGIIDAYSICSVFCREEIPNIYRSMEHGFIEHMLTVFIGKCRCEEKMRAYHVEDFTYSICGKRYLLKMHPFYILVRVGGGWIPIEQLISKKDPCKRFISIK